MLLEIAYFTQLWSYGSEVAPVRQVRRTRFRIGAERTGTDDQLNLYLYGNCCETKHNFASWGSKSLGNREGLSLPYIVITLIM